MNQKILKLTRKWWFYLIIIILNFTIPPIATNNFKLEDWGPIINKTLRNSFSITTWEPFAIPFQIVFIVIIFLLFITKGNGLIKKYFALFVSLSYFLYTIGQNIAISDKYGLSIITINIIMFMLVAYSWLVEFKEQKNDYEFKNWKAQYIWLVVFSIIAFWAPIDYSSVPTIDLHPKYFITSGSALAFCLTTPLLLTIMTLNIPKINIFTYRVTALVGTIIGIYNMMLFNIPELFWLAVVHIPLMTVSLFSLINSYRIEKKYDLK
tara:strand:+ start:114 stop:908 length:795 start_codon:yes stop_codon:yes gene_type:complete